MKLSEILPESSNMIVLALVMMQNLVYCQSYYRDNKIDFVYIDSSSDYNRNEIYRTIESCSNLDTTIGDFTILPFDKKLNPMENRKIEGLYASVGQIRSEKIGQMKNLKRLYINNQCSTGNFEDSKKNINIKTLYIGELDLWKEISKSESIVEIAYFGSNNVFLINIETGIPNYYLLDGIDEEIFEMKSINSIYFGGLDFFSVNYHQMKGLKNIYLENIPKPEALSLAAALFLQGADTSRGNLKELLNDIEFPMGELPINGKYQLRYKDGKQLCEGSFKNALPDGHWTFYYNDGSLCESRYYEQNRPVGQWLLTDKKYGETISNSIELHYKDCKLIKRVDNNLGNSGETDSPSSNGAGYDSNHRFEYLISYENNKVKSIETFFLSLKYDRNLGTDRSDTNSIYTCKISYDQKKWFYEYSTYLEDLKHTKAPEQHKIQNYVVCKTNKIQGKLNKQNDQQLTIQYGHENGKNNKSIKFINLNKGYQLTEYFEFTDQHEEQLISREKVRF